MRWLGLLLGAAAIDGRAPEDPLRAAELDELATPASQVIRTAEQIGPLDPAAVPGTTRRDVVQLEGQVRIDPWCLFAVTTLTVGIVLHLTVAHCRRWAFPRLQVCDIRVLFFYASLSCVGLAKALTGWPLLPLRALIDTYTVYLTTYALPVLLLGGEARLEQVKPEAQGVVKLCRRVLLALLVLRPLCACALLLAGLASATSLRRGVDALGLVWWGHESPTYYTYLCDTVLVVLVLLVAATLQSYRLQDEGARSGSDAAAKVRREVPQIVALWVLTGQIQDLGGLYLFPRAADGLALSGVLIVYEVLGVLLMTHRELDPQRDLVLAKLPVKADGVGRQLQLTFAFADVVCDKIPFEKSMFYSMRTALQDDAARLYAPDMSIGQPGAVAFPQRPERPPSPGAGTPPFDPRGTVDPRVFAGAASARLGQSVVVGLEAGLAAELGAQPVWVPGSGNSGPARSWPQAGPRGSPEPVVGELGQSLPVPLPGPGVPPSSRREDSEGGSIYGV